MEHQQKHRRSLNHMLERTAEALGTLVETVCITIPVATYVATMATVHKYKR